MRRQERKAIVFRNDCDKILFMIDAMSKYLQAQVYYIQSLASPIIFGKIQRIS